MSALGNGAESQSNHRFSLCSPWISFFFSLLFDFIPLFAALVPFLPAGGLLCSGALRDVASASAHNIFAFDAIALDVFLSFASCPHFYFRRLRISLHCRRYFNEIALCHMLFSAASSSRRFASQFRTYPDSMMFRQKNLGK